MRESLSHETDRPPAAVPLVVGGSRNRPGNWIASYVLATD
jgi:hypothetical protein